MTTPVTPKRRVIRTAIQTLLAVLVAVPAAVALLPLDASDASTVVGITGALVVLISAAQNALDAHNAEG